MRITEDKQTWTDFDWYCVDGEGCIGHFASAGFKQLPPSVARSAEDLNLLDEFFSGLPAVPDAHELDQNLRSEQRTPRYLQSFVAMADRGLFSFDIESYLRPDICYFRVAMPKSPLRLMELPENIRSMLGCIVLKDRAFGQCSCVPYLLTLSI